MRKLRIVIFPTESVFVITNAVFGAGVVMGVEVGVRVGVGVSAGVGLGDDMGVGVAVGVVCSPPQLILPIRNATIKREANATPSFFVSPPLR
jgi:hypothetical protein